MKELIQLISDFRTRNEEGTWEHRSAYLLNYDNGSREVSIFCYEDVDGCVDSYLATPQEYFDKLCQHPFILSEISEYERNHLKLLVGDNAKIIHYDTDYALSVAKISFYCIYNFRKIEIELNIETMNIKVFDITKGYLKKQELIMPIEDLISATTLTRELFADESLEIQKCKCKSCNHTYFIEGMFSPEYDKCIHCNSSENVLVEGDSVQNVS